MRADSVGLFWEDVAKVKPPKKEKVKRTPPEKFWTVEGYIPPGALEEAQSYEYKFFNDMELYQAMLRGERLVYDLEVYPNYFLAGFKGIDSGKYVFLEEIHHDLGDLPERTYNREKLKWILEKFTLISFNGKKYDDIISALAVHPQFGCIDFWNATCMLIQEGLRDRDIYSHYSVKKLEIDSIDIKELTAQGPSLKKCAARLHAPRLQDLPFIPGTYLTDRQIVVLRRYNINDLDNTQIVYESKLDIIAIREQKGKEYGVDLRSSSDAQMAEAIVGAEIRRMTGRKYIQRTKIDPGTAYKYRAPTWVNFKTPMMQDFLRRLQKLDFVVNHWDGGLLMPPELDKYTIKIAEGSYAVGIGGLHSQEKSVAWYADDEYELVDTDATSYYPTLILNAGLKPQSLGDAFIQIYRRIVQERVAAKHAGDDITAQCLKIVINGTFGKLGNMYSIMYAPHLMLQVTITGQLSLLMLIERFELAGIRVINANTDGVVARPHKSQRETFNAIVKQWERETGFGTEETLYKAYMAKDVNNYLAQYVKPEKGQHFKTKGLYAKTSSAKNAVNEVCILALKEYLINKTSVEETIRNCTKPSMFTTMRETHMGGGAVKGDQYLGKVVRWYYAKGETGEIQVVKTGNKVARSDGAIPLMDLPDELPEDLDYDWYIAEANKILGKIGTVAEEGESDEEDEETETA